MKVSLTILLALAAFAYSIGCVFYYEGTGTPPPDYMLIPLFPGIWVGSQVMNFSMACGYAALVGTTTVLATVLGSIFEFLGDHRRID